MQLISRPACLLVQVPSLSLPLLIPVVGDALGVTCEQNCVPEFTSGDSARLQVGLKGVHFDQLLSDRFMQLAFRRGGGGLYSTVPLNQVII